MGRKATFNDPARQVVQTVEDQHKYDTPTFRRLQINATTTNNYVTPDYKGQAGQLSTALAESLPTLALTTALLAGKAHEGEKAAGQAARIEESGLDPEQTDKLSWFSSSGFKKGYWETYGIEQGQIGKDKLQADWDSDPNRNAVPTNEWTANWYKTNTKGMNGDALVGFNREVAPALMKLANQGTTEKINDITATVYNQRYNVLTKDWTDGNWSPEQAKKRQDELKMSNTDFDELQVKVLDQFARQGDNPEAAALALKTMRENRPDGTPGIAFKANIVKTGWVEQMETQINQWANAKASAQETADRDGRSQEQKELLSSVRREAILGNHGAATKSLRTALSNGKISERTWMSVQGEINEIVSKKKTASGGEGGGAAFNNDYATALETGISLETITQGLRSGKYSRGEANELLNANNRGNKEDRAIFSTNGYKSAKAIVDALPDRPKNGFDEETDKTYFMRKSLARSALADYAAANPKATTEQLRSYATNIFETESRNQKLVSENTRTVPAYYPKYPTAAALSAAIVSGKEKDQWVIDKDTEYWRWRESLQNKGVK